MKQGFQAEKYHRQTLINWEFGNGFYIGNGNGNSWVSKLTGIQYVSEEEQLEIESEE